MTTKPPSKTEPAPPDSLEHLAYAAVEGIPTADPHDLDRLGYNIWLWLKYRRDPLEAVVRSSRSRLLIDEDEALRRIREKLSVSGTPV